MTKYYANILGCVGSPAYLNPSFLTLYDLTADSIKKEDTGRKENFKKYTRELF